MAVVIDRKACKFLRVNVARFRTKAFASMASECLSGKTRPGLNQRTPRSVIRSTLGKGEVVAAIRLPGGDGELELGLLLNGHQ